MPNTAPHPPPNDTAENRALNRRVDIVILNVDLWDYEQLRGGHGGWQKKIEVDAKFLVAGIAFLIIAVVGSSFVTFLMFRSNAKEAAAGPPESSKEVMEMGPPFSMWANFAQLKPNRQSTSVYSH